MKRLAAALLPLLATACTEAPPSDRAESGTAYIHTMEGVLEVDYVVQGNRVVVDDLTIPIDDFFGAVIDEADLDDAIAGGDERAAVRAIGRYRWPGGRIPFRFAADLDASQQASVNDAIAHWEANTPVRFVARTNETDFVTFARFGDNGIFDSECHSDPGRSGGEQFIDVDVCRSPAIIHEIGHLVGFYHEQTRIDRDAFVTINWDHITAGKEGNFRKYTESGRDGTDVGDYDYASIMHYGTNLFSADGQATITPKIDFPIGTATGLSRGDIQAAYRLVSPGGEYVGGPPLVGLAREPNLGGIHQDFGLGTYVASRGDFFAVGDNATSSIFVAQGVVVTAMVGGRFEPSAIFTSTQNTLAAPFDNAISTITVSRGVTVYRDTAQTGVAQTFRIGDWSASGGHFGVIGDNQISSLYVPVGLVAELCTSTSGGTCSTFETATSSLSSTMDNQASVIHVKPAATLFKGVNLSSTRKSLTVGTYTAGAFGGIGDDAVSSLVVGDGLQATLCANANGTGDCAVFRGDVSFVGVALHNKVSWIKIEPNTLP